jgi:tRNA 2-thiouridine synthesizing protein E
MPMSMPILEMSSQETLPPFIRNSSFPHAPQEWGKENAERYAQEEGIILGDDHWETIRTLQECFADATPLHRRSLHDALDEKFHSKGGFLYLYKLFPGGPVAQGCRMAGLVPPIGVANKSLGTVQ